MDDDVLVLKAVQRTLERLGYAVIGSAVNGLEAVELARTLRPDVILDIEMPRLDGIAAARKIQDRCSTPVVVLTAHDDPQLVAQARDAGVVSYLVKPLSTDAVARVLPIALARFEDRQELRRLNAELQAEIVGRGRAEEALQKALIVARIGTRDKGQPFFLRLVLSVNVLCEN